MKFETILRKSKKTKGNICSLSLMNDGKNIWMRANFPDSVSDKCTVGITEGKRGIGFIFSEDGELHTCAYSPKSKRKSIVKRRIDGIFRDMIPDKIKNFSGYIFICEAELKGNEVEFLFDNFVSKNL